jgi:hypothetical protein
VPGLRDFFRRALSGDERLWKIWWLGGIPVALAATAFTLSAELMRIDGHHAWGDFLDVLKLLVYAAWIVALWRAAGNAESSLTRVGARFAISAGVLTVALTV